MFYASRGGGGGRGRGIMFLVKFIPSAVWDLKVKGQWILANDAILLKSELQPGRYNYGLEF